MDPILALIVIEQTIATVVIAVAIVIYSRATTRILEAHVEPEVHVRVEGGPDSNSLTITNSAGCTVSNLNVIISAGCVWGSQPYPARHCLYFGAWETIVAGSTVTTVEQPIRPESFMGAQLPNGATVDVNDIAVEYSYTRRADKRRYSLKYQLGTFTPAADKPIYIRMEEPRMVNNRKHAGDEAIAGVRHEIAGVPIALDDASVRLGAAAPCIG